MHDDASPFPLIEHGSYSSRVGILLHTIQLDTYLLPSMNSPGIHTSNPFGPVFRIEEEEEDRPTPYINLMHQLMQLQLIQWYMVSNGINVTRYSKIMIVFQVLMLKMQIEMITSLKPPVYETLECLPGH